MAIKLPTEFAPAERLDLDEVKRQAEELLRVPLVGSLLGMVPDPMVALNECRQIIYANPAFIEMTGATASEALLGLRPGEALNCIYANQTEGGCGTSEYCRKCGGILAVLRGLTGRPDCSECTILCAGGEALDLRVWAWPVELGGRSYVFFFLNDRSAEKRRLMLERIFFHDVLNTAGGLYGFADLLKQTAPPEGDVGVFASTIFDLSHAVIDEIEAQKELAAAESHELITRPEAISSRSVLEDVARAYGSHEVARGKKIVVAPDTHDARLIADRTLLWRVVGNMLKNALEASDDGQQVTLRATPDGDGVRFSVHNLAVMPRDTQLQVFKRSFSTKGDGRGIGTYSIKLLGESYLKGRVGFESLQGQGTTFWVRVPLSPPDLLEPRQPRREAGRAVTLPRSRSDRRRSV